MKNSRFFNVISCFLFCFVFSLSAFINGLYLQGRRSLFSIEYGGGGGRRGGVDLITSVRDAGLLGDLGPSSPRKV